MTTYYHFSQLAPGNWEPGHRYHTPEDEQNFYWQKVFARASYEQNLARARVEMTSGVSPACAEAHSHVYAVAAKDYMLACFRELLFEMVRQEVSPQLPSRSKCLFLVESRADLSACAKRYGFSDAGRTILEIEALDGSRVFKAQAALLETTVIAEDILGAARQYWKGASLETPPDEVEILMTGPFRIRGVLHSGVEPSITIDGRGLAELLGE
jgi:hypothetical protein